MRRTGPGTSPEGARTPGDFVQSLDRGLAVIRSFGPLSPRQSLSEVARATGQSPAAARRFLLTLQSLGYVRSDGRNFELCPKVMELGYSYLAALPWWRHAQGVAERLARAQGQPCAVGVLEGADVVYVAYATSSRFEVFGRAAGVRLPAFATAVGRMLLAGLDEAAMRRHLREHARPRLTPLTVTDEGLLIGRLREAAQAGYSYVDQEFEIGLASISVPIRDRAGRTMAAISISFQAGGRSEADARAACLDPLGRAAAEIEQALPS